MNLLDSIYLKAESLRIPLHILLELTQRCNENCIHCYIKGAGDKFSLSPDCAELSLAQIAKLLDELAQEGALNLTLSGGEAMLREDFFDIAKLANEKNFALHIFSNGQFIDDNNADKLIDIQPACVYFSIYGADVSAHDRVTQLAGSFDKLINAVRLLKKRDIKVGLKTVVTKFNRYQLNQIFAIGKALGAQTHEFAEEITSKINGSAQVKMAQIDDFSLYKYYKGNIPAPPEYIEEVPKEKALKRPVCGAGVIGVCISCYGDIYPCAEWRIPLGNIKYQSFKDIWHRQDGFLNEIRLIKEYKDLPDCDACGLVNFCRRCPGRALLDADNWRLCYENAYKRALITKKINDEFESLNKEVVKHGKEGI